ncbi:PREDICTED: optic atrophy 3 protein homolog [Dinoponera quadriceps]|uniref:Optic atrophy 3 protein homolog n=1 Tax=Dinoponera quadriceps TaxID=609295 RepID=A0A6P3XPU4_DINQU|nr:PREDICTED: optic atrophy 3 protein homolog [Dinoponera quadriceps]
MPVGVFPVLKLSVLFVKQISKPLAKVLVSQAKNSHVFRTYVIIPPAQFYHWLEVKTKMYVMNLGKPTKVAKLNEAMAIELGASLLSEIIIFGVAGGCLMLEYSRQTAKEAKKEEIRQIQMKKFTDDIQILHNTTLQQKAHIQYLTSAIDELANHGGHKLQTPKPILQANNNNDSLNDNNNVSSSKNSKSKTETNIDNKDRSLINRAIEDINKNLKVDTLK